MLRTSGVGSDSPPTLWLQVFRTAKYCFDKFKNRPPVMTSDGLNYRQLDAAHCRLGNLPIAEMRAHQATLIRNAKPFSDEEFHSFCFQFGHPLPYGDGPEFVLSGDTFNEDDLHYDGISSSRSDIIPSYLVFYVEKALPESVGGQFTLVDCVGALAQMPNELLDFLKSHRLEFYGYPLYNRPLVAADELSFDISCISSYRNEERLRLHVPFLPESAELSADKSKVYSKAHKFWLAFSGCDGLETQQRFDQIREILRSPTLMWTIQFQDGDILVVDNETVFHGRYPLAEPSRRTLRRIQLLASPYKACS